jgi:hypothetical protein
VGNPFGLPMAHAFPDWPNGGHSLPAICRFTDQQPKWGKAREFGHFFARFSLSRNYSRITILINIFHIFLLDSMESLQDLKEVIFF